MHAGSPPASRSWLGVITAALALLSGCGGSKPPPPQSPAVVAGSPAAASTTPTVALPASVPTTASTRATLKLESTWGHCREAWSPGAADAATEAARLAQICAAATRMHQALPPFVGDQSAASKPQTFHWKAQAGHCYRAYGVGGAGIKNLDLLLVDSQGATLGQAGNDDAAPVVLDAGAVCFNQDDDAALVVSVGNGSGRFAVEVWGD